MAESRRHLASTYQAIVEQSVGMTGATCGWLLGLGDGVLTVLATVGPTDPAIRIGSTVEIRGARGFAMSSDQPTALMPSPSDLTNAGLGGFPGVPPNLLVATNGQAVLEVAGKIAGEAFTFDDIEALSAFAHIAGAAVADSGDGADDIAGPAELAELLAGVAVSEPGRYRDIARIVTALVAGS